MTGTSSEPFVDTSPGEQPVRGFLHAAADLRGDGLVLTHGAGANCQAPLLAALADVFAAAGVTVLRCDLPFRQQRPHGPPLGASGKHDQEGLRRAAILLKRVVSGRLFLGGHSYGGRQASMLASSDSSLVSGLLLLSYPLHPPQRPSQMRTAHFPILSVPALFVHGSRDPFGSIPEMEAALALLPAPARLFVVEGAGHSLAAKGKCDHVAAKVVEAFRRFFRE